MSQSQITWRNCASDLSDRKRMIRFIVQLLSTQEHASDTYKQKLSKISKKLEHTLYLQAENKADYLDMSTLRGRVQKIAQDVVAKKLPRTKNDHKAAQMRVPVGTTGHALACGQCGSLVSPAATQTEQPTQSPGLVTTAETVPPTPSSTSSVQAPTSTPAAFPKRHAAPPGAMKQTLGAHLQTLQSPPTPSPQQLKCPITLEVMSDPVVAMDGHTYERTAILQFFRSCTARKEPLRSPMTRELLPGRLLIENVAIRSQCREHQEKGQSLVGSITLELT